ncbi:MAG: exonuclease domain-containing protein [Patescibacteria group bacterium]
MLLDRIAFVDIETTGSSAISDKILEIAIICVDNNKVVKEYSTLLNPQMPFSPFIEMITGIKPSDVTNSPTFEDIQHEVYELLSDRLFIAHNVGFDYGFIKNEFKRLGLSFSADRCCTVKLSRHFFPEHRRHNLDSLIERYGFECESRHRAYSDTSVLWQFYQHVSKLYSPEELLKAMTLVSKRPMLPPHLDKSLVENLPEKPGVYIFYGEAGLPLYIGKSINIKERVFSHFANSSESPREHDVARQLKKIEYHVTTGELGALLLESHLVKEMQPIYNRKLRKFDEVVYILKQKDKNGYLVPVIKVLSSDNTVDMDSILAVHKTKSQAKKQLEFLQDEHNLCSFLLGLEKTSSGCFDYKLGKCNGGCLKKENPDAYNLRFEGAFQKTAIKPWPYEKPVMIHEVDIEKKSGENHIFNNWRYLGAVKYDGESTAFTSHENTSFDYDMYMILKQYLKSHPHVKHISMNEIEKVQEGLSL